MVVSGGQHIEARILNSLGILVGSAETRESGIRLTTQRYLEVSNGYIGSLHLILNESEAVTVVETTSHSSGANLIVMLHHVACKKYSQ